jgi:two-component system chemotaxis response regulator CheY
MALSQPFNIILMDWNMPNMLGIDAVKAIRQAGVKTPILMVTTEGERQNVITAIQAGANSYLVKPFTGDDLRERIEQILAQFSAG